MNRLLSFLVLKLVLVMEVFSVSVDAESTVLLEINGHKTYLSEFLYCYNNASKYNYYTPSEYFQYFYRQKMKIEDARTNEYSQTDEFVSKSNALKESVIYEALLDSLSTNTSLEYIKNFKSTPMLKIQIITYRLPQQASFSVESVANNVINDIYCNLKKGMTFQEIQSLYSEDKNLYFSDYSESWIYEDYLLDEMKSALKRVDSANMTSVFSSPEGLHIIKCIQRRNGLTNSDKRSIAEHAVRSGLINDIKLNELYNQISESLEYNTFLRYKLNQVDDALLIALWNKNYRSVVVSDNDLREYFKKHKGDYKWDLPHYKGGVIHCKDKKSAKKIKKLLKKVPVGQWDGIVSFAKEKNVQYDAVIEAGLFRIGSNPFIDRLVFKCGEEEESLPKNKDYPYTFVLGKKLNDGPDDYTDIKETIESDYKKYIENTYFDDLEKKFDVEIHQDVLKTVNCSGNN